ncbi:hypothetical protein BGX28_008624 [Mortierella sp. GBA30]|nr:hypothetical protein BGX28_008624 [Mortierella sp. GBA30]
MGSTVDAQSMSLSEAFALGYSIPTSKFNTEAFGTLKVPPASSSTSHPSVQNMITTTGIATHSAIGVAQSLDDILNTPIDFDDEDFVDMELDKVHTGLIPEAVIQSQGEVPTSHAVAEHILDSHGLDEALALRQRLAEMERFLKEKDEQLMVKTGEAAILKTNLDSLTKEHTSLGEKLKAANIQSQADKQALEDKHRRDLANANMNHQFEVQKFMLDGPSGSKGPKVSQLLRQPTAGLPTHLFPRDFTGFSSQSSVMVPARNVPPKSPRKSRSSGSNKPSFEKPRPFPVGSATNEPLRAARPVFGFRSDIPAQSAEEIIRDKLLGNQENDLGLRRLRIIKVDEEGEGPLPPLLGSKQFVQNARVDCITKQCVGALIDLITNVSSESKSLALKATAALLQASLITQKPFLAANALRVLRILYFSYKDIAQEVCQGAVPFLENEHEDPSKLTPSEASLPSALACIYCVFIYRIVCTSQVPTLSGVAASAGRMIHTLTPEAERQHELDIFLLIDLIVRDLSLEKQKLMSSKLIRSQIFDDALRLHLRRKDYRTLDRLLGILDIVSREDECSRLLVGWSITQNTWAGSLRQVDTLVALLQMKTGGPVDMANGLIPRLKIKVLEILERIVKIDVQQTKKIVYKTLLAKVVIYSVQSFVELAAEIHRQQNSVSIWRHSASGTGGAIPSTLLSTVPTVVHSAAKIESSKLGSSSTNFPDQFQPFSSTSEPTSSKMQPRAAGSTPLHSGMSISIAALRASALDVAMESSIVASSEAGIRSSFSSFVNNTYQPLTYKPAIANRTAFDGSLDSTPSSSRLSLLGPHHKIFDYLVQWKLEMELVLTILRMIPGYAESLAEREPNDFQTLAFAVSAVVVRDMGLPAQAQAQDVLTDLIDSEEVEQEYLDLVRDEPKKAHQARVAF